MQESSNATQQLWHESKGRLIPATFIGSVIEWYDIGLYAQAAALVFATLFFPALDPTTATLAAIATFGIGFAARPVGAVIFGHLGDRYGRKFILVLTLLLMGVATSLIGLLPTYESIGIWAPALLVSLRLVQGLGAGTEYAGAATLLAEYAPTRQRGFFSALPAAGVLVGIGCAAGMNGLIASLPRDQLLAWGWRIPFLISVALIAVGLFLRLRVLESPIFTATRERMRAARLPVAEAFRKAPRRLILTTIANSPIAFISQLNQVFVLTYLADRGVRATVLLVGVLLAALIGAIGALVLATVSDRTGRRPVYLGMLVVTAVTPFPHFLLVNTGNTVLIWLAMIASWLGAAAAFGVSASYFVELFEASYRVTGVALARETSAALLGAPAPLIAAALTVRAGGEPWLIASIMVVTGLAGIAATWALPETRGVDLSPSAETRSLHRST